MKKLATGAAALLTMLMALPTVVGAQVTELLPGQLVRSASSSSVYYIDADLSRYVFPNANVFGSWYDGFGGVITVSDDVIAQYPLAGTVPYKAAKRLIKLTTDPRVYAVDDAGVLRWIKSESVAKALYGDDWNKKVDDFSDAFFASYTFGDDIDEPAKFEKSRLERIGKVSDTLREHRQKRHRERGNGTDDRENEGFGRDRKPVCHGDGEDGKTLYLPAPALSAHLGHGDTAGRCNDDGDDHDDGNDDSDDTTDPVVSSATVNEITATGAEVRVRTDEDVSVRVWYSTVSPVASTAPSVSRTTRDDSHEIALTGLSPSTRYYVKVVVSDAAGNETTVSEKSFTTLAADAVAPTVSSVTVSSIDEDDAEVRVVTDEPVTAKAYVSTVSPVNVATAASLSSDDLDDEHEFEFTGLAADTTYFVKVIVRDAAGNETVAAEKSFTTDES